MTDGLVQASSGTVLLRILITLLLTLIAYGIFPSIIAVFRRKRISKFKYIVFCYLTNALPYVIFIARSQGSYSGIPYFFWTSIFSAIGIKILSYRGMICLFLDTDNTENVETNVKESNQKTTSNELSNPKKQNDITRNVQNSAIMQAETLNTNTKTEKLPEAKSEKVTVMPMQRNPDRPVNPPKMSNNGMNTTYCRKCGSIVDYNTKKCCGCGKQYFQTRKIILPTICVLLLVSIAMNIVLYFNIRSTEETRNTLNSRIDFLEKKVSTQENTIKSISNNSNSFVTLCNELQSGNIGYASNNFKASESIIVLNRYKVNRKFTLTAYWSTGGNVSVSYSSDAATVSFDDDTWTSTTQMTITPNHEGVTAATFTNDVDNKSFKVLIIVTN